MPSDKPHFKHYVVESTTSTPDLLDNLEEITTIAEGILSALKLKTVKKIDHQFDLSGITLAYILSESHLILHTWPEKGYLHLDLLTCPKEIDYGLLPALLRKYLQTDSVKMHELQY